MKTVGIVQTRSAAETESEESSIRTLITVRWVLIIAIAYLVLFSRPLGTLPVSVALFIAFYLGSNVVLTEVTRPGRAHAAPAMRGWLEWVVVSLDVVAVSIALYLSGEASNDLFVLYFVVLFLSALADGVGLAVGAALFIGAAHLYTASNFIDAGQLIQEGYIVRIPFLFAVALFFGNLVQNARARQRNEQNRLQRAQRMELLSTVSHDLRNPLGVIESLAVMLLDGDAGRLNAEQEGLLRRIRVSIRQVMHFSNNLIDAERIELNSFAIRRESCQLGSALDEALLVARTAAELKGVALTAIVPEMPRIRVDAVQIERAISNLLHNAIKFTPRGGKVHLAMRRDPDCLRIEVDDSGPGFPESLLADLGRKHSFGVEVKGAGSGLGLFIAAAVVKAHGGWLSAENRARGRGARVILNLPLREIEDTAPQPVAATDFTQPYLAKAG